MISFQRNVIDLWKKYEIPVGMIGNADQTPMTFDILSDSTIHPVGSSSVNILTTGHEKSRFTIMLCCMADGTKLLPYVVFNRKNLPKNLKFPSGIIARAQAKGWMDDDLCKDWVDRVWGNRPGGMVKNETSSLVLDAF